jgi:hypothetical protein
MDANTGAFQLLGLPAPISSAARLQCSSMPCCRADPSAQGRLRGELGLWNRLGAGVCKGHGAGFCRLPSAVRGRRRLALCCPLLFPLSSPWLAPTAQGHFPATYPQRLHRLYPFLQLLCRSPLVTLLSLSLSLSLSLFLSLLSLSLSSLSLSLWQVEGECYSCSDARSAWYNPLCASQASELNTWVSRDALKHSTWVSRRP